VAGRASIVGAAATHVGKVREHNEDAHFVDVDLGMFLVCDGMGGHAAGEVASALAIGALRQEWASAGLRDAAEQWLDRGTPEAKKQLLEVVRAGVIAAHAAILAEAERDETKSGMGTTLVGAMVVGGELVFAHAGDSRAYLVRDGISMQLTEDHTLLARLLAAGIDVDISGEGSRFRSMLTNALGIGDEVKVSTFVVPLADGDRFLLCSDGISEYVPEHEVGEVLSRQSSPARAAQRLIELALERGGGDNATAVVVRVLEAGETPLPAEQRKKDDAAIGSCALWGNRVTPQQRLRALRIAIPRDHNSGEKLPPHALGDRVAWIIVEGELAQDGLKLGPGALLYPESLVNSGEAAPLPDRDALATTQSDVRALAIRADDFRELCDDDGELGEALLESLAQVIAKKKRRLAARDPVPAVDPRGSTDPQLRTVALGDGAEAYHSTDPDLPVVSEAQARDRAATVPDGPAYASATRPWPPAESPIIAPVSPRIPPARPSPPPAQMVKRAVPPLPDPTRPSPLPAQLSPRQPSQPPSRPSPLPAQLSPRQPSQPPSRPPTQPPSPPSPSPAQLSSPPPTQPPSRPSPPPAQPPSRPSHPPTQPPSRPSPPPPPRSNRPSPPPPPGSNRPPPTYAQEAAAALPQTPAPAHGIPSAPHARDTPVAKPPADTTAPRSPSLPDSPWDTTSGRPDRARNSHVVAKAAPKGFAPALTPPAGTAVPRAATPVASGRPRPPTEPEIEAYFEIEADLPPQPGGEGGESDLGAELAFGIALRGDLDDEHESVSITIQQDRTRVTVIETSEQTLTVTVTDPPDVVRPRAITAEDGASVSGIISIPSDTLDPDPAPVPPRRAKRHSEGWDE
jgi:serine/threonine protein phosphatase PrpC